MAQGLLNGTIDNFRFRVAGGSVIKIDRHRALIIDDFIPDGYGKAAANRHVFTLHQVLP
jgi:hypothetical protein